MKSIRMLVLAAVAAIPCVLGGIASAQQAAPVPSGPHPITQDIQAPPLATETTDDQRKSRAYPEQPPVIPHAIRDYQIDLNVNKCLTCHSRKYTEGSQAPMISVTHFANRDGETLAAVSPRRYFCTSCHVQQTNAKPITDSNYVDIDTLMSAHPGAK